KAIKTLGINISSIKIINSKISDIIGNIKLEETNEKELSGRWTVGKRILNVLYKISYILLENNDISTLISFESINEIFNIALKFQSDNIITFENIIRHSYVMEDIISKAKIAARSDSTVFLKGESGTGKELFARSIHNASMRKNNPFIVINCATLPENLIESELFGYEKGSFTGASPKGKIGKFEQANNGTLFLDEIADLPLHLQSKLLRVLQEKSIEKIGSTDQIDVNVRIISATHRNLEDMVKRNEFREDLYYRLNVIPLHIPALRERENDVILITEYIINKLCKKFNKTEKHISKDVEEFFLTCPWHGNVRELENVLEYAINFSTEDEIRIEDLPDYFLNSDRDKKFPREDVEFEIQDLMNIKSLEKATREYEKRILKNLLEMYSGNKDTKKIIAKKLNISVTTLYRKLNDYYLND
ncbi:MAG TPA: sigma 54-interacting transcriptional regulator, partial [Treponemataceae bacterium]|nr:sigma 54-interacting transcriptional regulator [Treponemataceae bacterium]